MIYIERHMIQTKICSKCWGIYNSPFGNGKCLKCWCKTGVLTDVSKDMSLSSIKYFEILEGKLWKMFFDIIINFNAKWVMFKYGDVPTIHWRLWWVKRGIGKAKIADWYSDVLLCLKDKTPIPFLVAIEMIDDFFTGTFRNKKARNRWKNSKASNFAKVCRQYMYDGMLPEDDDLLLYEFLMDNMLSEDELDNATKGKWTYENVLLVLEKATQGRLYIPTQRDVVNT